MLAEVGVSPPISPSQIILVIAFFLVLFAWIVQYFNKNGRSDLGENLKQVVTIGNEDETTKGPEKTIEKSTSSAVKAGISKETVLWNAITLFIILLWFWQADLSSFPSSAKTYSRDFFLFIILLLLLTASTTITKCSTPGVLNRDQTEEWRGWMQVMFVWYHYFAAVEIYNSIRLFIAAYVWMTGFGNFSYFWVRKDFSMLRVAQMLFRLNFLVILVCMTLNRQYMLYYICAMHTYWFLTIYVFMRVFNSWNVQPKLMAVKFTAYAICNFLVFDVNSELTKTIFRPLQLVLAYDRPNNHAYDNMHEWVFRANLDHWAAFIGMLSAYLHPNFVALLTQMEETNGIHRWKRLVKPIVTAALGVLVYVWYKTVYVLPKFDYNVYHPYTFWIPLGTFVWLRNLTPWLRSHYLELYAQLGKITLETYLAQLHIYLVKDASRLMNLLPGYFYCNFLLCTLLFLLISHQLFGITGVIREFMLPSNNPERIRTVIKGLGLMGTMYAGLTLYMNYETYVQWGT